MAEGESPANAAEREGGLGPMARSRCQLDHGPAGLVPRRSHTHDDPPAGSRDPPSPFHLGETGWEGMSAPPWAPQDGGNQERPRRSAM